MRIQVLVAVLAAALVGSASGEPLNNALAPKGAQPVGRTVPAPADRNCPTGQTFVEKKFPNGSTGRGCIQKQANGDDLIQGLWEEYDSTGNRHAAQNYVDGKLEGRKQMWHPNGQKWVEATYTAGKENGVTTQWYANGQKEAETTFSNGVKNGPSTSWHENGHKAAVGTFLNGEFEGAFTAWHPNGQKAEELTLKKGKEDGLALSWDPSGKKTEQFFKDGKPVAPARAAQALGGAPAAATNCGWCPCGAQVKQGVESWPSPASRGMKSSRLSSQWCERVLDNGRIVRDGPYTQRGDNGMDELDVVVTKGQYKLGAPVGVWKVPGGQHDFGE